MSKNRMEKWFQYRQNIYSNISLHNEVIDSNERLSMLYKRLLNIFPEYTKIFAEKVKGNIKFKQDEKINQYKLDEIENLIEKLSNNDKKHNFNYLEKIDFSTGELDTIINDLESWNSEGKHVASNYSSNKILISKVKKITI